MYNHIDDVKATLLRGTGLGLLSSAPYMYMAIEEMETTLRFYYEKTKFPTVYGDAMILVKLSLFDEETWDDTDASHYTNGCRYRFLDVYATKSWNASASASASSLTPLQATNGKRSSQATFHDDVEYQQLLARALPNGVATTLIDISKFQVMLTFHHR